jgi:PAS domain S-box-containing protein
MFTRERMHEAMMLAHPPGKAAPPGDTTASWLGATRSRSALALSLAILLVGCLLTLSGSHLVSQKIEQDAKEQFDRLSGRIAQDIERRLNAPLYALRAAHGLHEASKEVTRLEFRRFVSTLDVNHQFPGVRGFGFIQRVMREDLAHFTAAERADGAPQFNVKTKGQAADLYVIKQIEPISRNQAALGLDVGGEAVRREGIERAVASGRPTLTNPITLVQDQLKRPGLLFFYPIYKAGAPLDTPPQRKAALAGVYYNPIVLEEVMTGLMDVAHKHIDIDLSVAVPDQAKAQALFKGGQNPDGYKPHFASVRQITIGDRNWTLNTRTNAQYDASIDRSTPTWLTTGGLLLSGLLSLAMWLMASGRARAEALAAQMTSELDRLAQAVKLTDNAVMFTDTDSRITWVNDGFTRLYGYELGEVQGLTPASILSSGKAPPEIQETLEASKQLGNASRTEFLNKTKSGQEVWIDNEVQPIRSAMGAITGYIEIDKDVTSIKQAALRLEIALRDSEALLRTINTQAIVSIADRNGHIIEVNDAFVQASGYLPEELIGQDHRLLNSGVHPTEFWDQLWQTIANGYSWRGDICNRTKDGDLYWEDAIIAPFVGTDGSIEKYIAIRTDITQRKEAEKELRDSKALLDRAGRIAGIGGWQLDLKTDQMTWSEQSYRIHDRQAGTHLNRAEAMTLLKPEYRSLLEKAARDARRLGKPWDLELQETTVTGRDIWVRSVGEAEFENGEAVRLIGAFQDITERKLATARMEETASLLNNVLSAASEIGVIAATPELLIKVFNNGAERLLGYSAQEMIGHHTPATFHDMAEVETYAKKMSEDTGRPIVGPQAFIDASILGQAREWTYVRKDGSRVLVSLVVTAMHNEHGELIGYLGVARDVSQQKAYEETLRQATLRAEQASVAKSRFLANMSHEIRTPMNAILGMLRLLQKTALTPRQLDYTSKTEGAAKSLLHLLNDILDFSKVEAGKMSLDVHPFEIEKTLRDLAVILSSNTGKKPLEILFDIGKDVPPLLAGDALRLQQVLINLGGNAIKFTQSGEVILGVKLLAPVSTASGTPRARLGFSVRDTGIGIPAGAIARIFEGFTQAESDTTRKFGGTGLGLAISQRLIGLMGGKMKVDSVPGKGSTFSFEIELEVPAAEAIKAPEPVPAPAGSAQPPQHVLIVDDNATARQILASMADSLNWTADLADGGQQAIDLIHAALKANRQYDAIFMDWQMPGMDGWQTSQRIREALSHLGAPMIVMVTAYGREDLAQRTEQDQSLIDAFLVKPITAQMLHTAVLDLQNGHDASASTAHAPPVSGQRLQGMRILLVEDNLNNQQIARELLEDEGAHIQLANDGHEGFKAAIAPEATFDIILMDIQMPVMDGLTATTSILGVMGDQAPPIVAMTANAMAQDREDTRAVGMVDHVGKPFDLDELVAVLCKHTGRAPSAATQPTQPAAEISPDICAVAASQGIDLPSALHRLGGRQDVYLKLLRSFLKDLDGAPQQVDALWQSNDLAQMAQWLHTIKGLSATLGHQPLADVMAQGERAAKTPDQKEALRAWVNTGKSAIDQAIQGLNSLIQALEPAHTQNSDAPTQPLDQAELHRQCLVLLDLLERSDMAAMDLFHDIQAAHGPALGEALTPLDEAIGQLDFQQAITQCQHLLSTHAATTTQATHD